MPHLSLRDAAMQADRLTNSTQAALEAIAAEFANVSDRYARDFDAHTALQGPTPFQIPGETNSWPAGMHTAGMTCYISSQQDSCLCNIETATECLVDAPALTASLR